MGALFLWKGDDNLASVVIQNILSLGTPFANNITKNAYRAVFTLNNINMSVVNSVKISKSEYYSEYVCNTLESIDRKLSKISNLYIGKPNIDFVNPAHPTSDVSDESNLDEEKNKLWDNISKVSTITSIANDVWGILGIFKKVFDKFLNKNPFSAKTTQTIDLDSIPGKIICMCNCNCGSAVSDRPINNNMTDVLDGVKTTAKAAWSLLKTGATVVGLLKAGTKVAGLLKSGTTTAGIEY